MKCARRSPGPDMLPFKKFRLEPFFLPDDLLEVILTKAFHQEKFKALRFGNVSRAFNRVIIQSHELKWYQRIARYVMSIKEIDSLENLPKSVSENAYFQYAKFILPVNPKLAKKIAKTRLSEPQFKDAIFYKIYKANPLKDHVMKTSLHTYKCRTIQDQNVSSIDLLLEVLEELYDEWYEETDKSLIFCQALLWKYAFNKDPNLVFLAKKKAIQHNLDFFLVHLFLISDLEKAFESNWENTITLVQDEIGDFYDRFLQAALKSVKNQFYSKPPKLSNDVALQKTLEIVRLANESISWPSFFEISKFLVKLDSGQALSLAILFKNEVFFLLEQQFIYSSGRVWNTCLLFAQLKEWTHLTVFIQTLLKMAHKEDVFYFDMKILEKMIPQNQSTCSTIEILSLLNDKNLTNLEDDVVSPRFYILFYQLDVDSALSVAFDPTFNNEDFFLENLVKHYSHKEMFSSKFKAKLLEVKNVKIMAYLDFQQTKVLMHGSAKLACEVALTYLEHPPENRTYLSELVEYMLQDTLIEQVPSEKNLRSGFLLFFKSDKPITVITYFDKLEAIALKTKSTDLLVWLTKKANRFRKTLKS